MWGGHEKGNSEPKKTKRNDSRLVTRAKSLQNVVAKSLECPPPKQQLKDFADSTTTHGIGRIKHHINNGSLCLATMWFFIFLGVSIFCIRNLVIQVRIFLDKPVGTTTELSEVTTMEFPDIKVLLRAPFSKTRVTEQMAKIGIAIPQDVEILDTSYIYQMLEGRNYSQQLEIYKPIAFTIDDILESCTFNGLPCGVENFTTSFEDASGNCFIFQPQQDQLLPGIESGASFVFRLNQSDTLSTLAFNTEFGGGINIGINSNTEPLAAQTRTVTASVGKNTWVALSRVEYIDDTSGSNCVHATNEHRYSSRGCINECATAKVEKHCQCSLRVGDCTASQTICSFDTGLKSQALRDCAVENNCPQSCAVTRLNTLVSSTEWPRRPWAKYRCPANLTAEQLDACADELMTNIIKVDIYFDRFSSTKFTQSNSYTVEQLMCDIGGTTGLFLGSSFLSLVEFFELVFMLGAFITQRSARPLAKTVSSATLDNNL